ncbi:uncharacterized protein At5g01610-like [Impatiens glandulifera]|uniref:uncharacterized protein At5g01610-like n=1 Tax=Impatiens glandulifera TaxID=253017 RepID=UPI001FB149FC|nr:uncharacterized protein At5g01610-like [Impatiens glandulifera]
MGFSFPPHHHQRSTIIIIIISALISFFFLVSSSAADQPSAYEVLKSYNFPIGILPKGVTGYELEESTGKFAVYLNGSCGFAIENSYKLEYKSTIKGFLQKGKLSKLEGVKVKLLFVWVDIIDIERSDDSLVFSVGIAWAGFTVDNFEESPQCGCGFNCNSSLELLGQNLSVGHSSS